MSMSSGVAAIFTTLDDSDPKIGKETSGTSTLASHGDHIHPIPIPMGIYVNGGNPYVEGTSTFPYVWVPVGAGLLWDNVLELMYIG